MLNISKNKDERLSSLHTSKVAHGTTRYNEWRKLRTAATLESCWAINAPTLGTLCIMNRRILPIHLSHRIRRQTSHLCANASALLHALLVADDAEHLCTSNKALNSARMPCWPQGEPIIRISRHPRYELLSRMLRRSFNMKGKKRQRVYARLRQSRISVIKANAPKCYALRSVWTTISAWALVLDDINYLRYAPRHPARYVQSLLWTKILFRRASRLHWCGIIQGVAGRPFDAKGKNTQRIHARRRRR